MVVVRCLCLLFVFGCMLSLIGVVCCSLFVARWLLLVGRCVADRVCCLCSSVCSSLFVLGCLVLVVCCCLLMVVVCGCLLCCVWRWLLMVCSFCCCSLIIVFCLLLVVRCLLCVVACCLSFVFDRCSLSVFVFFVFCFSIVAC